MSTIVTRAGKGSPLTHNEVDANFNNLNTDKLEFTSQPVRHSVRPSLLLDFANTKTLDPRITFTRGSTGTFYDGKTVAKAEENLLLRSQEFDDSYWTKDQGSVTANSTTAPDGTTTADLYVPNTTSATDHRIRRASGAAVGTYVLSVFAKASGYSWLKLRMGLFYANFNLSTGALGVSGGTGVSSSIQSLGNDWYRCVLVTGTTVANDSVYYYAATSDNAALDTVAFSGDGTSGILLWGAQLEQRSSVTAYTATTTAPITNYIPALQTAASGVARFEHNPVTGESLGLEIEEQRTNLLLRSEEFDNASWTKTNTTVTANTIVAPDGTLTGDKLVENTATAAHWVGQDVSVTNGTTYTITVYAKASERSVLQITSSTSMLGNGNLFQNYVLSTGALGTGGGGTPVATITNVGNGWYRCSFTDTASATGTGRFIITMVTASTSTRLASYTGDGYGGIYLWGAQLEAGAFATSYIKTEGSQVTRSADSASMTGTNFSSWYRADEGTLYAEYQTIGASTGWLFTLDGGAPNYISLLKGNVGTANRFSTWSSGTNQGNIDIGTIVNNTPYKLAGAYAFNNNAFSVNASAVSTDTTVTLPLGINQALIGSAFNQSINGTIKKLAYYAKRLTNSEIQSLTTI